MKSLGVGDVES